jgi:hypothetical protein
VSIANALNAVLRERLRMHVCYTKDRLRMHVCEIITRSHPGSSRLQAAERHIWVGITHSSLQSVEPHILVAHANRWDAFLCSLTRYLSPVFTVMWVRTMYTCDANL